jgi:O-antigen ligase
MAGSFLLEVGMLLLFVLALGASVLLPHTPAAGALMLVAALPAFVMGRYWRPISGLDFMQIFWFAWVPLTLFWSLSVGLALDRAGVLLCMPMAYLAWRALGVHRFGTRAPAVLLVVLLSTLVAWGLIQGPETYTGKPQGPFNDPNTFAGVLGMLALPLLAHYLAMEPWGEPRWRRVGYLILLAGTGLVFFLIASRGATLGLILVVPALFWLARGHAGFSRKLVALTVSVLVAYLASDWIKSGDRDIFLRLAETVREGDSIRVMLMQSAVLAALDQPWLGAGLGSFRLLYPRYRLPAENVSGGGWAHNDYLQLWLEAGLPMLLIMLAMLLWLLKEAWNALRNGKDRTREIVRFGYIGGALVIFLQAATNFMFYFAVVALLLGMYFAQARPSSIDIGEVRTIQAPRSWRMATTASALILALLFFGNVMVELLLDRNSMYSKWFARFVPELPRYELAYRLAIFAPFHPMPQHVMATELASALDGIEGGGAMRQEVVDEVRWRMSASQRLAPCYVSYGIDALAFISNQPENEEITNWGMDVARANIICNPAHGLSRYYAGVMLERAGYRDAALDAWRIGIEKSIFFADRLILAAAILARTLPGNEDTLQRIVDRMVKTMHFLETHPNTRLDQSIWVDAQQRLRAIDGNQLDSLLRLQSR